MCVRVLSQWGSVRVVFWVSLWENGYFIRGRRGSGSGVRVSDGLSFERPLSTLVART